ncbi:MAG: MFS transporter [Mycetocola sp.]
MSDTAVSDTVAGIRSRVGLFAAFAGMGGTAATIPALIPSLELRLGSAALSAVPALFTGLLIGVLLSAPLLVRFRARTVAALGALVQAASLIALTLATAGNAVVFVAAVAGVGFGLTEAAASVAAKRSTAGSATRTLAALTGTVAVVAAVTPILVAVAAGGWWLIPVLVAVLHLTACLALFSSDEAAPGRVRDSPNSGGPRWSTAGLRVFVLAALALVIYVGIETVFSGWSAVIPAAVLGLNAQTAALGTSVFWICMAAGRFLAAGLLHRGLRPGVLLVACTAVATSALGSAVLAPAPFGLLGLAAAVVAMAPVYSLVLGEALDRLPSGAAARATGPLVAAGALGGTLVPAAVLVSGLGPTSTETFLLSAVLCLVLCGGAILVLLFSRPSVLPVSPPLTAAQHESSTP